ncbi:MAG: hypothetical protein JXR03_05725 [Cyclobacteriaceae bacterium]
MNLPPLFEIGFSSMMYLILIYIFFMGLYQYYKVKVKKEDFDRSFISLGALALIIGVIAYIQSIRDIFDAIAAAGDISPSLIAAGLSNTYSYPTLGLICLGLAYLFRYINQ